jgi:hypothetical protein
MSKTLELFHFFLESTLEFCVLIHTLPPGLKAVAELTNQRAQSRLPSRQSFVIANFSVLHRHQLALDFLFPAS